MESAFERGSKNESNCSASVAVAASVGIVNVICFSIFMICVYTHG